MCPYPGGILAASPPETTLVVHPGRPALSWDAFKAGSPPFSIALDGYVTGPPRFDIGPTGNSCRAPRASFNHHEGVDRLATRSTSGQVLLAMRKGLYALAFQKGGTPTAVLHVSDADEDCCLSVWLLRNPGVVLRSRNPTLNRLVAVEDLLDVTAGAYPFPVDMAALEESAWVFAPYKQFRLSGEIERREEAAYRAVIEEVGLRIDKHLTGRGERIALDTRYEVLRRGTDWVMVRETGAQARAGMARDGIHGFVSVRERPDGRWTYSVGRLSPYSDFDVPWILAELDRLEADCHDPWGGSDDIGGSGRSQGSRLDPDLVFGIVESLRTGAGPLLRIPLPDSLTGR